MSYRERGSDKRPCVKVLFLLISFLLALPANAANHYVRQGASGNGSDWANACSGFTGSCAVGSLVRGDTYYVAAGTYAGPVTWNTKDSGTSVITIKHASVADHGTETGWMNSYAGQAIFTERNTISTDYWLFDGVSGDYTTGGIGSYGFKFQYSVGGAGAQVLGNYVTLKYIDCAGYTGSGDYNYPDQAKCIEAYGGSYWTVSHVAMHGCESCLQGGGVGWTVEYSYIYNSRAVGFFHNNVFYCTASDGGTFRYNKVWDYNAEGFFVTGYNGPVSNIAVYGNVFWSDGTQSNYPRGIELRADYSYSNIQMYNNTFYNLNDGAILDSTQSSGNTCTNCVATNNLSVLTGSNWGSIINSNNTEDTNKSRFVDVSSFYSADFHLKSALAGASLNDPYNMDMDGKTRGADGVWDRGAYEYGSSAQPGPPTNLQFQVQ
jgi:hypothetical protein